MTPMRAHLSILPRFLVVGGFGFAVDAGILLLMTSGFGLAPLPARLVSISLAITATWALHRGYTFRSHDPHRLGEWARFASINGLGAAFNYSLYAGALTVMPGLAPLAALVIASAGALAVNFLGSTLFAFRAAHRAH